MRKYFPTPEFFQEYFKKMLSITVSVKVWIMLSMIAMRIGNLITSDNFTQILITVAVGRITIESINVWKNGAPDVSSDK